MLEIKHLTAPQKMPIQFSRLANWPWREWYSAPPSEERKLSWISYSLDKAFHLLEFQAKLFFTRNRVGGFYWDSLLIVQIYWTESVSPSVLFATMYEKQTCYVYFLSECTPSSSFYVKFENSEHSKTLSLSRSGFSCTDCSSKEELLSNCQNCTFCMVGSYAAPEGSCIPCPAGTFFSKIR